MPQGRTRLGHLWSAGLPSCCWEGRHSYGLRRPGLVGFIKPKLKWQHCHVGFGKPRCRSWPCCCCPGDPRNVQEPLLIFLKVRVVLRVVALGVEAGGSGAQGCYQPHREFKTSVTHETVFKSRNSNNIQNQDGSICASRMAWAV